MFAMANNHVVKHFNFEELTSPDEVAGNADIRLRGRWLAAGVIMLCEVPIYVQ